MPTEAELEAIDDAIADGATKPQSASVDGNSVTRQSADDELRRSAAAHQQGITVNQLFGHRTRLINGPRQ